MMAYTSTHRYARISARKARLVVDQIRGKQWSEATTLLQFSKKRAAVLVNKVAAVLVNKVLQTAASNAEHESEGDVDKRTLVVTEARVDEGPTMKRFQPKDRGRAHPIAKRTSHICITVDAK